MNLYWVYLLPNWIFGTLTVLVFVVIGLAGLYVTRGWVPRLHHADHSHNDIVGFYLAAVTVLYGITVGLLAIATWTAYSDAQARLTMKQSPSEAFIVISAHIRTQRVQSCRKICENIRVRSST
jgi:hypothetical protein